MKLKNHTRYSGVDLRRILTRVLRDALPPHRAEHFTVHVKYRRRNQHRLGHAYLNSNSMTIELKRPRVLKTTREFQGKPPGEHLVLVSTASEVAETALHEVGHCLGHMHVAMKQRGYTHGAIAHQVAWAKELPLRYVPPKKKVRLTGNTLVERRLANARRKLAEWVRRERRAKTGVRNWQRRVRYYERRQAELGKEAAA